MGSVSTLPPGRAPQDRPTVPRKQGQYMRQKWKLAVFTIFRIWEKRKKTNNNIPILYFASAFDWGVAVWLESMYLLHPYCWSKRNECTQTRLPWGGGTVGPQPKQQLDLFYLYLYIPTDKSAAEVLRVHCPSCSKSWTAAAILIRVQGKETVQGILWRKPLLFIA